jgi:hypothetical protein
VLVGAAACAVYAPNDDVTPGAVAAWQSYNALLDQADAASDPAVAKQLRDDAAAKECLVFGCPPAVGTTTVSMDPTLAAGYFAAPWPSDSRRRADGSLDLTGFPGRSASPLADLPIGRGEVATFGYGTNSGVFFQTTAALAPSSLPAVVDGSVHRRSNVMLLDLDHPGAAPVPLLTDFKAAAATLRPANLLTLLPYPGHPLAASTRYAAVAFDGLTDVSNHRLAPSPLLGQLDGSPPAGVAAATWTQLRQERDLARVAVRAQTLWHPSEMVAFAVFTTQHPTADMQAIATSVATLPPPQPLSRVPEATPCTNGAQATHSTGRLALPKWQQGTSPYLDAGGNVVIGAGGAAVQQGTELGADGQGVKFDMNVPCGAAPANGWPVLLFMDGTGGSAHATGIQQLGGNLPYAVLSIAPLYSGDRTVSAAPPFNTPDFQFFNELNPVAARTNELQQAADVLYLQRIAQDLVLGAGESGSVGHLDGSKVVLVGHSQGAVTLPLTLAFDPGVRGAFLSSGGAGLYHSIVHRSDVHALVDGILGIQPAELDIFHPIPQLLQTFAEEGDAANYASAVHTNVVMYGGLRDGCSAIEVSVHLATAMGLPITNPVTRLPLFPPAGSSITKFEPPVVTSPVSGDLPGGLTGVLVEVDDGHFGASDYPAIGRSFVDSIASGGPVVENPGATPPHAPDSSCVRFDPPPVP